ncbi:MAG: RpiB/LacA/LacB family sugar-phosphate isomerase [Erysipelotrichaceae bacterium]
MKVALINENSQASKNQIIFDALNPVLKEKGHILFNYGMYSADSSELTYVQVGLLTAILINAKAVDFVVTGCGTGQGAMLACNSFPKVLCGHVTNDLDAYLFAQVNDGNAIAMPFAQSFGWGAELNLSYTFKKLFEGDFGLGYPRERAIPEQRNKKILDEVKLHTHQSMISILKSIDQDFLKQTISGEKFQEYFFANSQDEEISTYLKTVLAI